jgi:ArsR family transcriptional regulator, lead/cadmium/zinc/bismuth-responsive transcriptional repressor
MKDYVCEVKCIHEKTVKKVKSVMLEEESFLKISNNFKVLGDPTRIRILYALAQRELCVCDLAAVLAMSQSAISHQLRLMRNMNMVKFRKDGKMAYYSLADEHVVKFVEMGVEHAKEKN